VTTGTANVATLSVTGDGIVSGNLTVNGTTNYVNVTNLNIQDPIIGIGRGANNAALITNDGKDRGEQLWYFSSSEKSAFIGYDNSAGNLIAAVDVSITGEVVTVNSYGNLVVGTLAAATVSATGNVTGGNLTTAGLVSATGNVAGGNLTTTGLVSASGNVSGNYFLGNGSQLSGIAVSTLANGTSNLSIPSASGNILTTVSGVLVTTATTSGLITLYSNWANTTTTGNLTYIPYTNSLLVGTFTVDDGYVITVPDNAELVIL
jgi:hypothetical protein